MPACFPQVSNAGLLAFASDQDGNIEVYVIDLEGANLTRLTATAQHELSPGWFHDGNKIVDADGRNKRRVRSGLSQDFSPDWSPSGDKIAFTSFKRDNDGRSDGEIYIMNSDGSELTPLTDNEALDAAPSWAPAASTQ